MVHLGPLPGSPSAGDFDAVLRAALTDADALLDAGFDGLVVENFGDVPFHRDAVEPITVAAMARVASALVERSAGRARLCINVLRNDARSALAIAAACGADSIRVNVHSGARWTDQGLIEGRAAETMRLRRAWGPDVAVWADAAVKHSTGAGFPPRPVAEEIEELTGRGGADAVIITGASTGRAADPQVLAAAIDAAHGVPVLVGSGVTLDTIAELLVQADGVIVGTALKVGGVTTGPVDPSVARAFVAAVS